MSRRALLVVAAVSVALAADGAAWWRFSPSANRSPEPAAVECPREIDLGTVEIHRTVEGVVPITNTSGGPLVVRSITTSCGCLGVQLLPIDLTPAVLYLPRNSSAGAIYSGVVTCRALSGDVFSLRVGAVPAGLTVAIEAQEATGFARVSVVADPKSAARETLIPLIARCGEREYALSLRVVVEPAP